MTNKKVSNIQLSHGRPTTRREMLARGFASGSACLMMPAFANFMMANTAKADECDTEANDAYIPFLVFDLVGGPGLPGNFLVGRGENPEAMMLASYDRLGWNPRANGAIDRSFGIPMAANASQVLRGINAAASATTRANLRIGSFCHFSQDDTSVNKTSPLTLVSRAGYAGSLLHNGVGTSNSPSGGNTSSVYNNVGMRPLFLNRVSSLTDALSFGPPYANNSIAQRRAMANAINDISQEQAMRLANRPLGDRLLEVAKCAYERALGYSSPATGLDARQDTDAQAAFGINANTADTDINAVYATIAMNVLKGQTGPGVMTVSGCDYHGLGLQATDAKDLEIGTLIGRSIELAARLQKKLFFQVLADGGVSANQGTRIWSSDDGSKSMTIIGYYDPTGPASMRRIQVGRYTEGQGVDRTTLIGADPAKVAYGVLANYLNLMGDEHLARFDEIAGRVFSPAELDSLLIFA